MADNAHSLSNAEIADRLASLAQLLSAQRENPYKVKAYQRAAAKIRTLSESIDELVREEMDLTSYAGIGEAISGAIQEIVRTGTLGKLEKLRSQAPPELASLGDYPRLDPSVFFVFIRSSASLQSMHCAKNSKMANWKRASEFARHNISAKV